MEKSSIYRPIHRASFLTRKTSDSKLISLFVVQFLTNNVSFNEIIPVSFDPLAKMKSPTVESNYSKTGQIISDRRIIGRV